MEKTSLTYLKVSAMLVPVAIIQSHHEKVKGLLNAWEKTYIYPKYKRFNYSQISEFTKFDVWINCSQHVKDQYTIQQNETVLTDKSIIQQV